jgi:adenosylhomocysteine nucleosidase
MINQATTLFVFALEQESCGLFPDVTSVHVGIGKINAAYNLTRAIYDLRQRTGHNPSLVLNLGTAGSTHFAAGAVVNCTRFIQRDVDATPLGVPMWHMPFDPAPAILTNGFRFDAWPEATCGSGDNFVTKGGDEPWQVVDMEAYALAKVCHHEKLPFACLKYISDGADSDAPDHWQNILTAAAQALKAAVEKIQ